MDAFRHLVEIEKLRLRREAGISDAHKQRIVYFIQRGVDGPIKIGHTASTIERRLSALQTGHPEILRVLATFEDDGDLEKTLHERFAEHRIRGEWFKPHEDLLQFIVSPTSGTNLFLAMKERIALERREREAETRRLLEAAREKHQRIRFLQARFWSSASHPPATVRS